MIDPVTDTGFADGSEYDVASRVSGMHERARVNHMQVEWFATFIAALKAGDDPIEAARHACREWDV